MLLLLLMLMLMMLLLLLLSSFLLQTALFSKQFRALDAKVEEPQGYLRNAEQNMSATGQCKDSHRHRCIHRHMHSLPSTRETALLKHENEFNISNKL